MKKIVGAIAIVLLVVASYFYYTNRLKPSLVASSFCKEIENNGVDSYKLSDYLFSDFEITPLKSFETAYEETQRNYPTITKEEFFKIWSETYLSRCFEYDYFTFEYPRVNIMSKEVFKSAYGNFIFFDFKIKHKEFNEKKVKVTGEVEVKYKDSTLGNSMFGGKQKFTLLMADGKSGWRITAFSLTL